MVDSKKMKTDIIKQLNCFFLPRLLLVNILRKVANRCCVVKGSVSGKYSVSVLQEVVNVGHYTHGT